jgi:hypothetical protein
MNMTEIAKGFGKEKREMLTLAVSTNTAYTAQFPKYHHDSLKIMYAEWHIAFPEHKQDMNCSSCRAAVCKFWEMMVDEWTASPLMLAETKKATTKKNTNGRKKRKAK